jgi:hypothetical protein
MTAQQRLSRLRGIAANLALYAGAIAFGLGSAWWVLKKAPWMHNTVQAGAWRANLHAGSQDADLYTRAGIALNALLALDRSETMYFVATQDDAGRPLRARCNYRVTGTPPAARWWSITAYADDMFLFDTGVGHHSLNGSTARLDGQGRFALTAGSTEYPGTHWLATKGDGGLVLTLRLYNPSPALQANPASLAPPSLTRQGDCP